MLNEVRVNQMDSSQIKNKNSILEDRLIDWLIGV